MAAGRMAGRPCTLLGLVGSRASRAPVTNQVPPHTFHQACDIATAPQPADSTAFDLSTPFNLPSPSSHLFVPLSASPYRTSVSIVILLTSIQDMSSRGSKLAPEVNRCVILLFSSFSAILRLADADPGSMKNNAVRSPLSLKHTTLRPVVYSTTPCH